MLMNRCFLVLSYNHPELTKKCVQSIVDVALQAENIPIVLVHNGSESIHVDRLIAAFPEVRHVRMEKNLGYSGGLNYGLKKCFTEFERVIFVTNDVELVSMPKTWPVALGFYAPKIFFRKLGKIDSLGATFIPHLLKLIHIKNEFEFERILSEKRSKWKIPYVPGTAFVLDRVIYEKIGSIDESLHTYWEDVDFSARVFLGNQVMGIIKDLTFLHKVGKTCHQKPFYTTYLFQRNKRIVSFRYCYFLLKPFLYLYWLIPFIKLCIKFKGSSSEKYQLLLKTLDK